MLQGSGEGSAAQAPERVRSLGLNTEFTRGGDGKVDGFTVSVGRAAGIVFKKQPNEAGRQK